MWDLSVKFGEESEKPTGMIVLDIAAQFLQIALWRLKTHFGLRLESRGYFTARAVSTSLSTSGLSPTNIAAFSYY